MAIKDLENDGQHQVGAGRRKEDLNNPKEKALPRVRFTGQQPGEEGVEKDEKPGRMMLRIRTTGAPSKKDEKGEEIVPVMEPSTEGKFSA
jgi:hypothetical protein